MAESGWFNDLDDPRLARWFDGEVWTEHTIVKAEWEGPGAPPPPVTLAWIPEFDEPPPSEDPPVDPPTQVMRVRRPPSNIARVTRRYRHWPLWGRIAAPAGVAVLLIAAISSSGDKKDQVDTTTASTISIDDAVDVAMSELNGTASPIAVRQVVEAICDNDVAGAAAAAAASAGNDPQATANLVGAAGNGANEHCPEVAKSNPTLLNRIQGAAQALLASTTSTSEVTTSTTASTVATTATTKKAPVTTKAPVVTQAPVTTQPPVTTPPPTTEASTTTVPAPPPDYVTPGAFCSGEGAEGQTSTGNQMVCSYTNADGTQDDRLRWRAA